MNKDPLKPVHGTESAIWLHFGFLLVLNLQSLKPAWLFAFSKHVTLPLGNCYSFTHPTFQSATSDRILPHLNNFFTVGNTHPTISKYFSSGYLHFTALGAAEPLARIGLSAKAV